MSPSASAAWRRSSWKTLSPASAAARAAHASAADRCALRDAAIGRRTGASERAIAAARPAPVARFSTAAPNRKRRAACPPLHEHGRTLPGTTRSSVEDPTAECPDRCRRVKHFRKKLDNGVGNRSADTRLGPRIIATARPACARLPSRPRPSETCCTSGISSTSTLTAGSNFVLTAFEPTSGRIWQVYERGRPA